MNYLNKLFHYWLIVDEEEEDRTSMYVQGQVWIELFLKKKEMGDTLDKKSKILVPSAKLRYER